MDKAFSVGVNVVGVKELLGVDFLDRNLDNGNGLLRLFYLVDIDIENIKLSQEHELYNWFDHNGYKNLYILANTSKNNSSEIYIEENIYKILAKIYNI